MLYELLTSLADRASFFNLFRYITVRTVLAGATAFGISLLMGPLFIRFLQRMSIGQSIREEGPKSHHAKSGTPTMGGVLILATVLVGTLAWADLSNLFVWTQLAAMLGFGAIGFVDDRAKILKNKNLGLTARAKMGYLIAIAGACVMLMMWLAQQNLFLTELYFPFFKNFHPDLGWFFVPFAIFVLIGSSNAVNLTDGLDGLAIGSSLIAFATFTVIAYVTSHIEMADYLDIPHLVSASELVIFGGAMGGACLGFLWFNAHPAQVFMGDTGALALGGSLGCMALLTGHPLLLIIVGGLFVIEAVSVILQVASYKWRKKRIFLMAPIHHHFELKGWHESQVIIRFWIAAFIFAMLALATLKVR